jgi:hypothetical protein
MTILIIAIGLFLLARAGKFLADIGENAKKTKIANQKFWAEQRKKQEEIILLNRMYELSPDEDQLTL